MPNNRSINEEAGLSPNWVPVDQPPIVPGQTVSAPPASDLVPKIPQYFQGSIPPNFQHDANFVDTATVTPNAPKYSLMPLGLSQNSVSSTQITSVIKSNPTPVPTTTALFYQEVEDNLTAMVQRPVLNLIGLTVADNSSNNSTDVSAYVTLNAPIQYTLPTQTVLANSPLVLAWATEPDHNIFAGGTGGGSGVDGTGSFDIGSATNVNISVTTSSGNDFYLLLPGAYGAINTTVTPGTWSGTLSGSGYLYTSTVAGSGSHTFNINAGFSVHAWAPSVAAYKTTGTVVAVQYSGDTNAGSTTSYTFGSPITAGNAIFVAVSGSHLFTGASAPPTMTVSDNAGNAYNLIVSSFHNGSGGPDYYTFLFAALGCAAASTTVTVTMSGSNGPQATLDFVELSNLTTIGAVPNFRLLYPGDLAAGGTVGTTTQALFSSGVAGTQCSWKDVWYQTVQSATASKTQRHSLNFTPATVFSITDNSGNDSTDVALSTDVASGVPLLDASGYLKTAEFPAFSGDVSKPAGGVATTVVGLQTVPVSSVGPTDGQLLTYVVADGKWEPKYRSELVSAQTGTSYTFADGNRGNLVTFSNISSVAVTLPQAGASSLFLNGWFVDVENLNKGVVTITPTTSTIDGLSSITLLKGEGFRIVSDGTNYQIVGYYIVGTPSNGYAPVYNSTNGDIEWTLPLSAATPINLTAQQAAITTANLLASAPAGMYRASYYLVVSRAATTSSSVQLTIGWTDDTSTAQTKTSQNISANTVGAEDSGSFIIYSGAAQNITYAASYASSGATAMQYALRIRLELLG